MSIVDQYSGAADAMKFRDPRVTVDGSARATVKLRGLETLWFNTGTLCNLTCAHCYIESSPTNDRLAYIARDEVRAFLDEIRDLGLPTREIGLTGGEPFMNPDIVGILDDILSRGFEALVLTNAMAPMRHRQADLLKLQAAYGAALSVRVSLDHYAERQHDAERGPQSWSRTTGGLQWLAENGFHVTVAGRSLWHEPEAELRAGFAALFKSLGVAIDAKDPSELIVFPEMDENAEVPEITTACWGILDVNPDAMMCASSRMVVKRKGAAAPTVVACTLLPYDTQFEIGTTLADAEASVPLNHPHCARFCVLGGGSCTA